MNKSVDLDFELTSCSFVKLMPNERNIDSIIKLESCVYSQCLTAYQDTDKHQKDLVIALN